MLFQQKFVAQDLNGNVTARYMRLTEYMELQLLIADDDARVLGNSLQPLFSKLGPFKITIAITPTDCINAIQRNRFDIILLDLSFSSGQREGTDLIPAVKRISPDSELIVLTSYTDNTTINLCLSRGADDYISKNFLHEFSAVELRMKSALGRREKRRKIRRDGIDLAGKVGATFKSRIMEDVYSDIAQIRSQPRMHVLVTGNTGVGKDLVARAISRQDEGAPFYPVNASCFGRDLLEGELFGYEKGSFTGADKQKIGIFELAHDGDIFLDEVATLSLEHQSKLLRVLQTGEFYRIGGTRLMKTTARVIAATNENLEKMVADGAFREDLLQRLQRFKVCVPSLSERKEDIPIIIQSITERSDFPNITITEECVEFLASCNWPRNVRQLEDCVISMIMKSDGKTITVGDIPKYFFDASSMEDKEHQEATDRLTSTNLNHDLDSAVHHFSKSYIRNAMKFVKHPITIEKLAMTLNMSKSSLHKRLVDYDIDIRAERKRHIARHEHSV